MASLLILLLPSVPIFQYLILFILIQMPPYLSSNDNYTSCATPYDCGVINNMGFPFWGQGRPKWCGHPLLQLNCDRGQTFITIKDVKYKILDPNPDNQTMRIARVDYFQDLCPSKLVNTTLDTELFVYGSEDKNLTLFYNCDTSKGFPINCFPNGTSNQYFYAQFGALGPPPTICTTSVVIPYFFDIVDWTNIQAAISNGFFVRWIVGKGECLECQKSGGACGYDWNSNQTTCYCRDQAPYPWFKPCPSSPNAHQDDVLPPSGSSSTRGNWKIKAALGASAAIGGVLVLFGLIICYRKRYFNLAQRRLVFEKTGSFANHNVEDFINSYGFLAPKRYSYSEVKRITNSFCDQLGQGGYGVVYKGSILDGRNVAVKVISEFKGSGEEFINEVASISRTSHVNIVSLFGFCNEMNKRALIYEFMPNGSLDKFIYKMGSPNAICDLAWNTLYQITISIARGLEYLHRGCSTRILHLDIKPQNILLDEDFCPKIADFGLAKICKKKESIVSILGTRGTPGYIAPEVFSRTFGGVSHKSDVYSYGMLILEVVGGRKNYDNGGSNTSELYFPDWIYKDLDQGNIPTTCLVNTQQENDMVMKITLVSLWCIQANPSTRPSMSKVVEMLEGPLQSVSYPPKPVLNFPELSPLQFSDISYSSIHETDSITPVENGSIK